MTNQSTPDREAFEKWHASKFPTVEMGPSEMPPPARFYVSIDVNNRWLGWQAARASESRQVQTGLTDMGFVLDAENEGELAAYDQGCAECNAAVSAILDGKDQGEGACNEPWASLRARLLALVKERQVQEPVAVIINDPGHAPTNRQMVIQCRGNPDLQVGDSLYATPISGSTAPVAESEVVAALSDLVVKKLDKLSGFSHEAYLLHPRRQAVGLDSVKNMFSELQRELLALLTKQGS